MSGTSEFGEVSYTLTNCTIAAYSITGNTYSTPADLAIGQTVEIEPDSDNDELRSYGVKARILSVVTGAKVKVGMGGVDISILAIMGGISNYTSGLTPNQMRRSLFPAGGAGLPYFGLIGLMATDDGGAMAVGLQAVKLNSYPKYTLDGKENKFNMSETEGYAVPVTISSASELMVIRTYETAANYTAPTTGANFLAFFTA